MLILLLLLCTTANAGESTIVLSDNTTIKTVHVYNKVEAHNPVVELKNPREEYTCFDEAKKLTDRASRFAAIDRCVHGSLV